MYGQPLATIHFHNSARTAPYRTASAALSAVRTNAMGFLPMPYVPAAPAATFVPAAPAKVA